MSNSKKIILTVLSLIAIPWFANQIASTFLPAPTLKRLSDRVAETPPAFLAIGTSRMSADLNPGAFQNQLVILAVPFMDIEIIDMVVRSQEDLLKKTGQVYLEYHPEMMTISTLHHQPEIVQTLGQLNVSPWMSQSIILSPSTWQLGAIFPFLSQVRLTPRQILGWETDQNALKTRVARGIENGFQPHLQISDDTSLNRMSKEIYRQIKKYDNSTIEENGIKKFLALDARLRKIGVNYCWLELPKHPSLRGLQRKDIERVEAKLGATLAEKRCLDPQKLTLVERELVFSDPNHLQAEATQRFSEVVQGR